MKEVEELGCGPWTAAAVPEAELDEGHAQVMEIRQQPCRIRMEYKGPPMGTGTTAVPVAGAGGFCAGCGVPHPADGAKFCTVRAPSARVRALRIRTAIMRTRARRAVAPRWV